ncbi:hypothetical protein HDU92_003529 [Lobulomyces angularis]|nr:hypothetical protein HDU92_003529 [Lobulomyces angularis]
MNLLLCGFDIQNLINQYLDFKSVLSLKSTSKTFYKNLKFSSKHYLEASKNEKVNNIYRLKFLNLVNFNQKNLEIDQDLLFLGCELGSSIVVENCILKGLNVLKEKVYRQSIFESTSPRQSCIYIASRLNHVEVVRVLLFNMDVSKSDTQINSALMVAVSKGNFEVVKLLMTDFRCNPSLFNNYSIFESTRNGYLNVTKFLMMDNLRVSPNENDTLFESCCRGKINTVKYLLQYENVDATTENNCCIDGAIETKNALLSKLLISDFRVKNSLNSEIRAKLFELLKENY